MVELRSTEVDGVRCFWVETGRPTLAAQLTFRFGMADEHITESGWQHLLEHLALHGRGGGALHVNGRVGLLETVFDAHGPRDAVAHHYTGLSAWLSRPQFDELARERGVLQAESELRGSSAGSRALGWRYGARGPGAVSYAEPGLGRATPEALSQRAGRCFTQGNTVMVLDGPPPASLRLTLPPGEVIGPSPAVPCEENLPGRYVEAAGVVLSGVVPRSAAMALAFDLVRQFLANRLRNEAGAAYAPWSTYERVDWDQAVVLGGSDLTAEGLDSVGATVLDELRALAHRGPPGDELKLLKDSRTQSLLDPYATVAVAARAAHNHLQQLPAMSLDDLVAEVEDVTSEQVAQGFALLHETLLLGLPSGAKVPGGLRTLSFETTHPKAVGPTFFSINWPASGEQLVLAEDRVELRAGGVARGVVLSEVEAMFVFADGLRHVLRRDGYGLSIEPQEWGNGSQAVARLDALVPAHLQAPHPARTDPPRVRRLNPAQRYGLATRDWFTRRTHARALVLAFLGYWVTVLVADALSLPAYWLIALVVGFALYAALRPPD